MGGSVSESRTLTRVVLHQLLEGLKLGSGGDVVASIVQFANFIVLDVVSFDIIPVLNGERVGAWKKGSKGSLTSQSKNIPLMPHSIFA